MAKKLPVLIGIFLLTQTAVSAQTNRPIEQNTLAFSTGFSTGALKNLEIAPLARYDYSGPIFNLNYERLTRNKNIVAVQLSYMPAGLKSDVVPALNLDYTQIGFEIALLKKVYTKNRIAMHLGLSTRSKVALYSQENISRELVHQTVGLAARFVYTISSAQRLTSNLIVPFALFRATHASSGSYSFNRYQGIFWQAKYSQALSNDFDIALEYNFNYDRLQILSAYREVQHQLNLGITYKF